jgi:hypothetical protein
MSIKENSLTPAQRRILCYCVDQTGWISLTELEMALNEDDLLTVPSLIELGLLEHKVRLKTVRATDAGRGLTRRSVNRQVTLR